MAQQTINIGASPNDGTGTPLRTAFQYTNSNFSELYTAVGPSGNNIVVPGNATITGDLTVATDRLKVVTGSTAVQIGSTTQTQFGTTAWPSDLIAKANSRVLVGNLGTVLLWNESAAAIGNASNLFIGAKSGAGATTFGGSYISSGIENASDRAGFFALSTFQSNGIDRERYRIDSTGVHTWQYVGGVAGTAMTLNANGLGIGVTPSAWGGSYKALQLQSVARNIAATGAGSGDFTVAFNAIYDSTDSRWEYAGTGDKAGRYSQTGSGNHRWFVSNTAGTAGNEITDFASPAMTLDASGNLNLGDPAGNVGRLFLRKDSLTNTVVELQNESATGKMITFHTNGFIQVGSITFTNSAVAYNTSSDYRLKESVKIISGGLARVNALKPSAYKWKVDGSNGEGFLAHELAEVVPFAVTGDKDAVDADGKPAYQGVDLSKVVPILVAAIQELTARVQTLEAR